MVELCQRATAPDPARGQRDAHGRGVCGRSQQRGRPHLLRWTDDSRSRGSGAALTLTAGRVPGLTAVLSITPLVWMGRVSYGLYLWHNPVFDAVEHVRHPLARFDTLWELIVTVAWATGSYYFVERPCLRLTQRLPAGRGREPGRAQAGTLATETV